MRVGRWTVIVLWLAASAVTTHHRLPVWASDLTLWTDAAMKAPLKPRPVMNLGRARELGGDLETAAEAYRQTIRLTGDARRGDRKFAKAAAQSNLAHVYMQEGRFASAMITLNHALLEYPDFPYAHYNKGALLWFFGACEDATKLLHTARSKDPALAEYKPPCGQSSLPR